MGDRQRDAPRARPRPREETSNSQQQHRPPASAQCATGSVVFACCCVTVCCVCSVTGDFHSPHVRFFLPFALSHARHKQHTPHTRNPRVARSHTVPDHASKPQPTFMRSTMERTMSMRLGCCAVARAPFGHATSLHRLPHDATPHVGTQHRWTGRKRHVRRSCPKQTHCAASLSFHMHAGQTHAHVQTVPLTHTCLGSRLTGMRCGAQSWLRACHAPATPPPSSAFPCHRPLHNTRAESRRGGATHTHTYTHTHTRETPLTLTRVRRTRAM